MALIQFPTLTELNPRLADMANFTSPRKWLSEAVKTKLTALSPTEWAECPFPKVKLDRSNLHVLIWAREFFGADQIMLASSANLFLSTTDQVAILKLRFPEIFH